MMQSPFLPETVLLLLKWLVIIVIWLLLAIELYRDSVRVAKLPDPTTTRFLRSLHKRNIQVYGLVSMLLVIIITDDINHEMQRPVAETQEKAAAPEHPPLVSANPAEKIVNPPVDTTKFMLPQNSKIPFSDITEFNEKDSKQQAYIDLLKQRYETWLITYYYLQKCGKVGTQDLGIITNSLKKELESAHADSTVETNINLAANGSYKEMYSDIPCDEAHIANTKAGYDATMQRLNVPEKPQLSPKP